MGRATQSAEESKRIPKVLTVVIQLLLVLFLASVVIASVNLGLNVQSTLEGNATVNVLQKAITRLDLTADTRLIFRTMLNIANGFESNTSPILTDRFSYYSSLLTTTLNQLLSAQNFLDYDPGYQDS